jgi:hypothetical protein
MDDQHLGYIKQFQKEKKKIHTERYHQSKIPIQYLESNTKEEVFFLKKNCCL